MAWPQFSITGVTESVIADKGHDRRRIRHQRTVQGEVRTRGVIGRFIRHETFAVSVALFLVNDFELWRYKWKDGRKEGTTYKMEYPYRP
jgi:hypothetical protein